MNIYFLDKFTPLMGPTEMPDVMRNDKEMETE